MTIFSAAASRDVLLIVIASIIAAVVVNIPTLIALITLWVDA